MTSPASRPGLGALLVLTAVFIFAVLDTITKYLSADYPVVMIAWGRYFFHFVTIGLGTLLLQGQAAWRTRRLKLHVLRAGMLVAVTLLMMSALARIPLADATAIAFVTPLLVILFSVLLLREKVGPHRWTAVALGLAGVLVILRPGAGLIDPGALFALGMTVCYAGYQITTRVLSATESSITTLFYTALVGVAVMSLLVPFHWRWPDLEGWGLMVVLGVLGGGGHLLLIQALRLLPASAVAPLTYSQIVFATILGLVVFGHLPDLWTFVGAAMITAGGLWSWYRERIRTTRSA
ncbi:DMT family transporter [Telmatospirillum sp. J64-1]|uniref:DMT family transporter n=1 Tax=Telmatospirillum sp. J64-1 TaxID=2502183 RepID=UPI00115E5885|nr:DMT family transporter [Telmatospirillum sp. J64-1]